MQPLVTIITSCYNHEKYLDDYFRGLLTQIYPNIELILFDDGSPDASWSIIESYIPKLKARFHSLICERHENIGPLREKALAISKASGEFICMLDSDDYYLPDKIQKNVDYLSVHPEFGAVYGNYYDLTKEQKKSLHYKQTNIMPSGKIFDDLCRECFIKPVSACFRAELLHKYVNYKEYADKGYGIGDYPLFLNLAHHCEFGYIDKPLACYRHVEGSLSRSKDAEHWVDFTDRVFRITFDYMDIYSASTKLRKYVKGLFSNYLLFASIRLLLAGKPHMAWTYFRKAKLLAAIAWLPGNLIKVLRRRFFS